MYFLVTRIKKESLFEALLSQRLSPADPEKLGRA